MKRKGFTLIELLIVVAIIAILAAIAVPNFLEAQTRAKVSRAKADMRSIATGLETYRIDWNAYPYSFVDQPFAPAFDFSNLYTTWWPSLTTPISYITFRPADPFGGDRNAINDGMDLRLLYDYRRTYLDEVGGEFTIQEIATGFSIGVDEEPGTSWLLYSPGPDREQNINTMIPSGGFGAPMGEWPFYDPTNGSISVGDIVRAPEGDETSLASR